MDLFDLEAKASPRMMHFANKPTTSMPEEIVVSLLWLASEVTCWSVGRLGCSSVGRGWGRATVTTRLAKAAAAA